MTTKAWFLVRSTENTQIDYLVSADNLIAVQSRIVGLGSSPIIQQLNWQELHELTGCVIPAGQQSMSFAHGNFMLLKKNGNDIVLWPV